MELLSAMPRKDQMQVASQRIDPEVARTVAGHLSAIPRGTKEFGAEAGEGLTGENVSASSSAVVTPQPAPQAPFDMNTLLAAQQESQERNRNLALLQAGLGMMVAGERSGATLAGTVGRGGLEGLKGLAAGQSAAAKQQLALATLGARQEANRIAAAKQSKYQAIRANLLRAWTPDKTLVKDGQLTRKGEELVLQKMQQPRPFSEQLAHASLIDKKEKWLSSKSNITKARNIAREYRDQQKASDIDVTMQQAKRYARKMLEAEYDRLQGRVATIAPADGDPESKADISSFSL
jgi:hypothetical protein